MHIRRKIAAIAGAMIVGLGLATVVASPASAATWFGPYRIRATNTNLCMDVRDVSQAEGALLQLYTCLTNQNNQRFWLVTTGVPWRYQIVAVHSGKCVDVKDVSYANGALIQQWNCLGLGQTNQLFADVDAGGGNSYLQAWHSGKCATYYLPATEGTNLIQESCYNRWVIE